jgi:hypothetical protein
MRARGCVRKFSQTRAQGGGADGNTVFVEKWGKAKTFIDWLEK